MQVINNTPPAPTEPKPLQCVAHALRPGDFLKGVGDKPNEVLCKTSRQSAMGPGWFVAFGADGIEWAVNGARHVIRCKDFGGEPCAMWLPDPYPLTLEAAPTDKLLSLEGSKRYFIKTDETEPVTGNPFVLKVENGATFEMPKGTRCKVHENARVVID